MAELLQWWNLIFILPFIGALFYILMLCTGMVAADHDAEFNVDIDHDAEINVDMDHSTGIEHLHDVNPGGLARALSFLGIGRVPMSVIIVSVCFLWGFAGFAGNTLLKPILPAFLFVWVSIAIALVLSIFCTRVLAALLSRVLPATETYAVSIEQLTGKWAEAITTIDETFGQAHVHDDAGVLHTVQCLVRAGESKISRGTQVILLFFDKSSKAFFVGTEMPVIKRGEDGASLKRQG
jgi:membrane protein implicated in regulation of membrane protease activity